MKGATFEMQCLRCGGIVKQDVEVDAKGNVIEIQEYDWRKM